MITLSSIRLFNISSMLCSIMCFQTNVISLETCILTVTDCINILHGNIKSNVTGIWSLTPNRNQLCVFLSLHSGIAEVSFYWNVDFSSLVIPLLTFGDSSRSHYQERETWRNFSWPFRSSKIKPLLFLETSGIRYPGTCRHVLEMNWTQLSSDGLGWV